MSNLLVKNIKDLLSKSGRVIVAIDGCCASGKTTLAKFLQSEFDANVFSVDDFFLRPSQKTKERLLEVGGNFDYERFKKEVIDPLKRGDVFCYQPYNCKTEELSNKIKVESKRVNIVEGSYSLHPYLGKYYDIAVFMEVSTEIQRERILKRDVCLHQNFFNQWIPKEQAYFEKFGIKEICQIQINGNKEK